MLESFEFRVERLSRAVEKRECREADRESSMGVIRYLFVP